MKIAMTGAAGIVGTMIRPYMAEAFDEVVLVTHRTPCEDLADNERVVQGDIQDRGFVDTMLEGMDGLVHLAGLVGEDYTFDQVLGPNMVGTYNLFQASLTHKLKQVVYASSHHAVGFVTRDTVVDDKTPFRPDSYYGVSKAFGEILAAFFADKFGLNVVSIRIGSVGEQAIDERRMHTWNSPRDLSRLIELSLTRTETGHRVVYGVSDCPDCFFDNSSAEEIGFMPQDRSLDHLKDPSLRDAQPDLTNLDNLFIGGYFATHGMSDDAREAFSVVA